MMCERFTACSLFQHEKVDDARSHDDADKESNSEGGGGAHVYDPSAMTAR